MKKKTKRANVGRYIVVMKMWVKAYRSITADCGQTLLLEHRQFWLFSGRGEIKLRVA